MRGEYVCIAIQFSISSFLFGQKLYYQGPMFGTYVWPDKEYNPLGISTHFLKYVVTQLRCDFLYSDYIAKAN